MIFVHTLNACLLSTHCVPDTRLGTGDMVMTETDVEPPFKEIVNSHREFVNYSEDL